jgi:hypothetical protein
MMTTNKAVPRVVPTLTEVVLPGQPASVAAIDPELLAEQVLQVLKPKLEQKLRASLQVLIEQQMQTEAPRIQREMEDTVRAAVAQTLARVIKTKK